MKPTRFNIELSSSESPIEYHHLHGLTRYLHKCLGSNNVHDRISLYSFGWLSGGRSVEGGLGFPEGASWRVSFAEEEPAASFREGVMKNPEVIGGMTVEHVKEQRAPDFSGLNRFETDHAPVILRRQVNGSRRYLLSDDEGTSEILTRILRSKLEAAGFEGKHLSSTIQFDDAYEYSQPRLSSIKGTKHKGSVCPVIVNGTPEVAQFVWATGAGHLTGSGFGALK